ncbi:unnamed protein product [Linum trigynum]|uniref:Uncharacterized protein n=1 Tax=Linum trigynum TaxID=586398 RepID=A0AAV2GN53_9ROSI
MATCNMLIGTYDKHRPATTPPRPQIKTLAAMGEAKIVLPPVATAPPPSLAEALADSIKVEAEDDAVDAAKPLPSEFETFVAVKVDPFPITSTLVPTQLAASLNSSPMRTTESPSLVVEPKSPLKSTVKATPASLRLTVKHDQHMGKLQTLLVTDHRQIEGYVLSMDINIISKYVIQFRGRIILGQIKPSKFRKKCEALVGLYGVDCEFLYWWKRRKKGRANMALTLKKGKLELPARKGQGLGGKSYSRSAMSNLLPPGNDNYESMEIDSSLPLSAEQSLVSSVENPDQPNFKTPIYNGVIGSWKASFHQRYYQQVGFYLR